MSIPKKDQPSYEPPQGHCTIFFPLTWGYARVKHEWLCNLRPFKIDTLKEPRIIRQHKTRQWAIEFELKEPKPETLAKVHQRVITASLAHLIFKL